VLDHYSFDIASVSIRVEHIVFLLVGAVWLVYAVRQRTLPRLRWDDILLALYLVVALIASLLYAPNIRESLKFVGLMAFGVLMYWLVRTLVTERSMLLTALKALVVVGVAEAFFGIVAWALYPTGRNLGVILYPFIAFTNGISICTYSPYGTLFEANIFGGYLSASALMLGVFLFSARVRAPRWMVAVALTVVLAGVAISLTRSVWVATLACVPLIWFAAEDRRPRTLAYALPALAAAVVLGLVASNLQLPCTYVVQPDKTVAIAPIAPIAAIPKTNPSPKKTQTPLPATVPSTALTGLSSDRVLATGTMAWRLDTYRRAIEDWLKHPVLGNGANVFAQRYRTSSNTPDWISNAELMALHDTGIVGLVLLLAWGIWIARDWWRAVRRAPPSSMRLAMIALGLGFAGLLVVYQATTAFWLGFTWVYLGLLRAGTLLILREQKAPQAAISTSVPVTSQVSHSAKGMSRS
jgi:O-antigen ligase